MAKKAPVKKQPKLVQFPCLLEPEFKAELEAEAERDGRSLAGYIRHMLATDPRRKKK